MFILNETANCRATFSDSLLHSARGQADPPSSDESVPETQREDILTNGGSGTATTIQSSSDDVIPETPPSEVEHEEKEGVSNSALKGPLWSFRIV